MLDIMVWHHILLIDGQLLRCTLYLQKHSLSVMSRTGLNIVMLSLLIVLKNRMPENIL